MPAGHCHMAAELPFVHAGVFLHPAEPLRHDFLGADCLFLHDRNRVPAEMS